jgi:PAS domain S-box-containing protein
MSGRKEPVSKENFNKLRRQAEERLAGRERQIESLDRADLASLAHELAVHRAELQIQNEELRQARTAAEEARDRYLDLYNFAPVGYFTLDEHSLVVEANLTASQILKGTRRNLLKTRFTKFINTDESDRFHFYQRKALESESRQSLEMKMQRADGTSFDAQLISSKAGPGRFRIAMIDITERKLLEEALAVSKKDLELKVLDRTSELRKSEADYRKIIETANEGVWITDPEGKVLFINDKITEMLGYSSQEIFGRIGLEFLVEGQTELVLTIRRNLREGLRIRNELQFYRKDGTPIWVLANLSPIFEGEKHTGNLYMMTDITEWKRAEEERKRAEKELVTLTERLRGLSHRLIEIQEEERTNIARELHDQIGQSLNVIKLLIDRARTANDEHRDKLCSQASPLLAELIDRVSTLSLDLRPKILDDLGLVRTLEWYFERFTTQTNIRIQFKPSGIDKQLQTQIANSVYRVVQEALTNVARHAQATTVTVKLKAEHSTINLRIEDNGVGFDPVAIDASASGGIIGMQERIGLLGGTMQIQSKPGAGTRVIVEIPYRNKRGKVRWG